MANAYVAWGGIPPGVTVPVDEPDRVAGFDETVEEVWIVQVFERVGATLVERYSTEDDDVPLRPVAINVTVDRSRDIRAEGTVALAMDEDSAAKFIPKAISDPLTPFSGHFLRIYTGFKSPRTGIRWVCPIATLQIDQTDVSIIGGELSMVMHGSSVERMYQRGRLNIPGFYQAGTTTVQQGILAIINKITPWSTFTTDYPAGWLASSFQITWDDDLWETLITIVKSHTGGWRMWFDSMSNFRVMAAPVSTTDYPVLWYGGESIIEGDHDQSWLDVRSTDVRQTWSGDDTYNGVILRCEDYANGTSFLGTHFEDDPALPLFYDPANPTNTKYGPNPKFESSTISTSTQAAADSRAEDRFSFVQEPMRRITTNVRPDARVEVGDRFEFVYEEVGLVESVFPAVLSDDYWVDSVSYTMGSPVMPLTLKRNRWKEGAV